MPQQVISPAQLEALLPLPPSAEQAVCRARDTVCRILSGADSRLLIICGPCSIGDIESAEEYAHRLKQLAESLSDVFFIVMRVFIHKPRTTIGWKGFVCDPALDGTCDMQDGLFKTRRFLLKLASMDLPAATEAVSPIVNDYLADLITWTAIGARSVECQLHREYASGLKSPVGFKNSTQGEIESALNAMESAQTPHSFLSIDRTGRYSVARTKGNPACHLVLRGGKQPNADKISIAQARRALCARGLPNSLVIDCSHGNSGKSPMRQAQVFQSCISLSAKGESGICGLMLESNLVEGAQAPKDKKPTPGLSLTDPCLSWEQTEGLLCLAASCLRQASTGSRAQGGSGIIELSKLQ